METTTLWYNSASSDGSEGRLLTFARRQGLQALNGLGRITLMGFSGTADSTLLSDSLTFSVIESNAVAVGERLLELAYRSVIVAAGDGLFLGDWCQEKAGGYAELLET